MESSGGTDYGSGRWAGWMEVKGNRVGQMQLNKNKILKKGNVICMNSEKLSNFKL